MLSRNENGVFNFSVSLVHVSVVLLVTYYDELPCTVGFVPERVALGLCNLKLAVVLLVPKDFLSSDKGIFRFKRNALLLYSQC